jgi:hypothetical protein
MGKLLRHREPESLRVNATENGDGPTKVIPMAAHGETSILEEFAEIRSPNDPESDFAICSDLQVQGSDSSLPQGVTSFSLDSGDLHSTAPEQVRSTMNYAPESDPTCSAPNQIVETDFAEGLRRTKERSVG